MSYRVGTTNYNLPQTEGTDKRDWSDTNQAFAAIDSAIKTASDDATLATSLAQTAQTAADGAVVDAAAAVTTANAASASATSASEAAALARTEAQSAVTTANSANTTAQAAQTTATNADTVALAAQTNIGTMANLQTTDKTSLVAAINEVLSQTGGGSGMPALDLANPIHNFDSSHLSFTAVEDCYLYGSLTYSGSANRSITAARNGNSNVILHFESSASGGSMEVSPIKIKAGTTLTTAYELPNIKVYLELE